LAGCGTQESAASAPERPLLAVRCARSHDGCLLTSTRNLLRSFTWDSGAVRARRKAVDATTGGSKVSLHMSYDAKQPVAEELAGECFPVAPAALAVVAPVVAGAELRVGRARSFRSQQLHAALAYIRTGESIRSPTRSSPATRQRSSQYSYDRSPDRHKV